MTFPVWGNENVVRQGTGSYLDNNATAMLPNGGYVVAWHSLGERKLYFQIYDGEGRKVGDQHSINGSVGAEQNIASAMSIGNDGSFAITWNESFGAADGFTVKTRVYNADGTPKTADAVAVATGLNSDRTSIPRMVKTSQGFATVYDADDNIAVAYHDLTGEVTRTINFSYIEGAMAPAVTALANGNLVVSYSSEGNLYFRIVDGNGNAGAQQAIGTGVYSNVVSIGGGNFAIVNGLSSGSINIRFYRDGVLSGPVEIARGTGDTGFFQATELSGGRVAIVYIAGSGADTADVYLRVVDANGNMSTPMLINNTVSDGNQRQDLPSVSEMFDGRLVITWNNQDVPWGNITTQIIDPRIAQVTVNGTQGNDIYAGSAFDGNILHGFGGNDKFFAGAGSDRFDGGEGVDSVTYERSGAGVIVNLDTGGRNADARGDTYVSIENLLGSAYGDTLIGNGVANVLMGGGGNDWLEGGAGGDALHGGSGIDTAAFQGSASGVSVNLTTGTGSGGDAAGDTYSSIENLYGSAYADKFVGNSAANAIRGLTGNDQLLGAAGNDVLYGGIGNDKLYGGTENDALLGEAGADLLYGEDGNDKLYGGTENDLLYGGAGNDLLKGDAGNDKLYGGGGKDALYGGAGKDVFVFDTALNRTTNLDRILDFSVADDTIWLDNAIFRKLGSGSASKPLKLNAAYLAYDVAKDANDYLIYNRKNGVLSYDADGSGAGRAVEIAILKPGLKLTYHDFYIV